MDKFDDKFSIRKQCDLLDINRSSLYYKLIKISDRDLEMMRLLDEQYIKTPFYGVRKMTRHLKDLGYKIGKDHTRTLLRLMGLNAIYPKPKTSTANSEHSVYPYLLRDVEITRANQVWSADITYIRLAHGFVYLVAIIDWYSRYVLSWKLSNTLDAAFCVDALKEALSLYGSPEIFNTDQGSQFTSIDFTSELISKRISISMDGRGRCLDNIFIERLWRSVKYENIFLHNYETIPDVRKGLTKYFEFYNNERIHQHLDYKCPSEIYFQESEYFQQTKIKLAL